MSAWFGVQWFPVSTEVVLIRADVIQQVVQPVHKFSHQHHIWIL
jgi:hypothetical protein